MGNEKYDWHIILFGIMSKQMNKLTKKQTLPVKAADMPTLIQNYKWAFEKNAQKIRTAASKRVIM